MAIATYTQIVDGHIYHEGDEIPDLGSFECVEADGLKRSYSGLSTDIAKLPKYDDLATDSNAKCLDTGDFYYYHAPTKTWYLQ